ncbi:MAG: insulinase family protein [Spirochaetes bacterium]|nr:insulinase family protein [Spirochaetota bacterium]
MKKSIFILFAVVFVLFYSQAEENSGLLKVKKYILDNGLTVYLNEDHTASKVYGAVVVKAGSKHDPEDCTGMAHFLEHMIFKGTQELGTIDYEKEKSYLEEISDLYDKLHKIRSGDENNLEREQIYKKINELSIEASKYETPNDFASLIQSIGGDDFNANTHYDRTVYHSAFPSSQTEKWLELYSHVLSNPVFRLYQAENEVVKEEKNRSLNSHPNHFFAEMKKYFFKVHPYGKIDTLGDVDHICYIPVSKMKEFYNTYYVANNMALILSGDIDTDKILPVIKNCFSRFNSGLVPKFKEYKEKNFNGRELVVKNVYGPERGVIAFRTVNTAHIDILKMLILKNMLLNSNKTGLLNKFIINNEVDDFSISFWSGLEESGFFIYYWPKAYKMSSNKIENAVIESINKIKNGECSIETFNASKHNVELSLIEDFEDLKSRTYNIIDSYLTNIEWEDYLKAVNSVSDITKEEFLKTINQYFNKNYFVFNAHSDWDNTRIKKVINLPYKEIPSNSNTSSNYSKKFINLPKDDKKPKFIDYKKDVKIIQLKDNLKLYHTKNPINNKFELSLYFMNGICQSPNLEYAADYMKRIGPKGTNPKDFKLKMESIGCNYSFGQNDQFFIINLYGAEENIEKGMELLNELITNPEHDEKILKNYIKEVMDHRNNYEKDYVPSRALVEYLKFKKQSRFLTRATNSMLNKFKPGDLFNEINNALSYKAGITFTGYTDVNKVAELISNKFNFIKDLKDVKCLANRRYNELKEDSIFYYNNYNKNIGSIYFFIPGENFNINELSKANAFNEYFCGTHSSVLFKEIRELRSLAYAVWGNYYTAMNTNNTIGYLYGYISFKMDKLNDVVEVLMDILKNMSRDSEKINSIKECLLNQVFLCNSNFRCMPFSVFNYELLGLDKDANEILYNNYKNINLEDIDGFYKKNILNKKISILILGSSDFINIERLSKLGALSELRKVELYKYY